MSEVISLVIAGIVAGSIYAVSATGLVLTYNTTGIFNFAHGALGMVLAYLFWQLWQGWNLPVLVSLALVLLVAAPVLGVFLDRALMRHLHGTSTNVRLAVTLGLLLVLQAAGGAIWNQGNTYTMPEFFNGDQVTIGGVSLSYEQLITIGIAVAGAALLRLFFKRTRTGVAMRAVVDDPGLADLAGAPSRRIASYAWTIGVMFAALAGILLAPTTMDQLQLTELVIFGYAAAVVGRLRSLPLTFAGSMVLGIAFSLVTGYVPGDIVSDVTAALPMAMLFLAVLLIPESRLALARVMRTRPLRAPSVNNTRSGALLVFIAAVLASALLGGNNLLTLGDVLTFSLLALSLTLLSGYGGQISLCQFTFLGLGALAMHWVGGSILGLVAAAALSGAVGAVLAIPVLRLRGLYLALATLAFAVLMDNIFFNSATIMGQGGTIAVSRPDIFGLQFSSTRSLDVLLGVVLALCVVGVGAVRRSPFGRRLVAMNDSPAACSTVGMSLTVTKLLVFALSAALAGLAGALYGGLQTTVGAAQFQFLYSVGIFASVTLAGPSALAGAVVAGTLLAIGPVIGAHVPQVPNFTQLAIGLGVFAAVRNPLGIGRLYVEFSERWSRRAGGSDEGTPSPLESGPAAPARPEVLGTRVQVN
jgi:branched-chain amino acid transport system permease protein